MAAYFIAQYVVRDPKLYREYQALAAPTIQAAGGKLVLLPVAWITGRGLLERLAAALFRATGQAGEWSGAFSDAVRNAGFDVQEKRIPLPGSEVMLLVCRPT